MKFSVVIPTYRGLARLRENLPGVFAAAKKAGSDYEIIIVDDGSGDGTAEFLATEYSTARVLRHEVNQGFIPSVNDGVATASNAIVFLLNNDVKVAEDCFTRAIGYFQDSALFAVTFKALYPGTLQFREGAKGVRFRAGFIRILHAERDRPRPLPDGRTPSLYPVGGHCAVRKSMFQELNGLDPLFAPFYWEDADLGYRAWKRGWKTVYAPECEVIHNEKGTIRSLHDRQYIRNIRNRNRLLFMWKNLDDFGMSLLHRTFIVLRVLFSWLWGDADFYRQLGAALNKKGEMLASRNLRLERKETFPDSGILKSL